MSHQNTAVAGKHGLFTVGLAAASAGVVALSLMSAPPPGIAARPAMQLESQLLVQLEAAIVRPAVAALPTPVTGSSTSSSTEPADTTQTNPIAAFWQQLQNDFDAAQTTLLLIGFDVVVGGFFLFNVAVGLILRLLLPGWFGPTASATASQSKTRPAQPVTTPNAAKTKIRAAIPAQVTASAKPQSSPIAGSGNLVHRVPSAASTIHTHSTAKAH
jgi:hypothetical protein